MKIVGFVGDICAGKTTIANALLKSELNDDIIYLEGDAEARKIYGQDHSIIELIRSVYPDCIKNGSVDTKILSKFFFQSKENQKTIEEIVHPILKAKILDFIEENKKSDIILILDVPVLFKLGLQDFCDKIFFFTADKKERMERAVVRISNFHKMSKDEAIAHFISIDGIAIKFADHKYPFHVLDTTNHNLSKSETVQNAVSQIIKVIKSSDLK